MVHLGDITKMSRYAIRPWMSSRSDRLSRPFHRREKGRYGRRTLWAVLRGRRIIREMRYATFWRVPQIRCLGENVPGAFSSNKGEDFMPSCKSLCRVIDPRRYYS